VLRPGQGRDHPASPDTAPLGRMLRSEGRAVLAVKRHLYPVPGIVAHFCLVRLANEKGVAGGLADETDTCAVGRRGPVPSSRVLFAKVLGQFGDETRLDRPRQPESLDRVHFLKQAAHRQETAKLRKGLLA